VDITGRLVALGTSLDDEDFLIGGVKYLCSKEKHRKRVGKFPFFFRVMIYYFVYFGPLYL